MYLNARSRRGRFAIRAGLACLFALAAGSAAPTRAYQQYSVQAGQNVIPFRWGQLPVSYFIENRSVANVSVSQLQTAVAAAFSTWQAVPTATLSSSYAGLTAARPGSDDGISTIGFLDDPSEPDVLGATDWLIDERTGAIVESDIFFNTFAPWSVAAAGETNRFDLQSIALHEIGHLWGLGHSAIGETEQVTGGHRVIAVGAVMFPIALSPGNVKGRSLLADDIAGISDLYPGGTFRSDTGSVTGTVQKNGKGVFGAHVVAFSPATGKLVGNFTEDDAGSFTISGLPLGPVILRVEPVDDADLDSFFDDPSEVDLNFRITYHTQLVIVPSGGASQRVQIQVTPK